jgi:glycosyltransferase involved in cell wall biosynthesis
MKITFFMAYENRLHEGIVRPFSNLIKGCLSKAEVSIALFNCGNELVDFLDAEFDAALITANTRHELIDEARQLKPDFTIGDDYFPRLRLLSLLRKIKRDIVAYAQVLYGSHAIGNCFDESLLSVKAKALYKISRLVPFSFLKRRYVRSLKSCDYVLANSRITATLLQILYGVDLCGIVYPPVDVDVFKPTYPNENSNEVILYVGSRSGDTREDLVNVSIHTALKHDFRINLLGNPTLASRIRSKHKQVVSHKNLTDAQLADLYSSNVVTICPQKWETFGYVPVESMACGTPVLAFNCMGAQETVMHAVTGLLATNPKEFQELLEDILRGGSSMFSRAELRDHVRKNFSIDASATKLVTTLSDVLTH